MRTLQFQELFRQILSRYNARTVNSQLFEPFLCTGEKYTETGDSAKINAAQKWHGRFDSFNSSSEPAFYALSKEGFDCTLG